MAEEADKTEKTDPPSPYKLREARKKGSVSKSQEFNTLIVLLAVLLLVVGAGEKLVAQTLHLCKAIFLSGSDIQLSIDSLGAWLSWILLSGIELISPLVVIVIIATVVATLSQTGPVFSFHPIKPDFGRINPVKGFKRIFSIRLLYEAVKNCIKLALFSLVLLWCLYDIFPVIGKLATGHPGSFVRFFIDHAGVLLFRLLVVLALVVIVDILFTRKEYLKNLKMTKREIKDEHKRHEGDPNIKSKRREIQSELRAGIQSINRVRDADTVITNPTHLAVALEYDREKMIAPAVTAKGAGGLARKIKEEARRYGVPVIENKVLARKLFKKIKMGGHLTDDCYLEVAKIYRHLYAMKKEGSQ